MPGEEAAVGVGDAEAVAMAEGLRRASTGEDDRPADPGPLPQAQITMTMPATTAFDLISPG